MNIEASYLSAISRISSENKRHLRLGSGPSMRITSHPGVASDLSVYQYSTDRVVEDGHIVTSRGAGTAFEFALIIIQRLVGDTVATRVATDIVLYE